MAETIAETVIYNPHLHSLSCFLGQDTEERMADAVLLEFEIVHMDELAGLLQRFKQVLVFLHACGDYGHLIVRIERKSLLSEGIHHDAVRLLCYGREPQKVAE